MELDAALACVMHGAYRLHLPAVCPQTERPREAYAVLIYPNIGAQRSNGAYCKQQASAG